MNYKQRHQREQEFNERSSQPLNISGVMEIEYTICPDWIIGMVPLKVTILYRLWSIDSEGVELEYKIVGSSNYLPTDFPQLVKDSLYEHHNELKGLTIYNLKQI